MGIRGRVRHLLVVWPCLFGTSRPSCEGFSFWRQTYGARTKATSSTRMRHQSQEVGADGGFQWNCKQERRCLCGRTVRKRPIHETKLLMLTPEENPSADPHCKSLSGVSYGSVLSGLNRLYPPEDLEKRNAVSRTDGYWPFVKNGSEPPGQFTYGEYDLFFFAELIDRALEYYNAYHHTNLSNWNDRVFADVGSGTGRLVLAAAALYPDWKLCRGIELLTGIHNVALEKLEQCHRIPKTTDEADGSDHDCADVNEKESQKEFKRFGKSAVEQDDWLDDLRGQFDPAGTEASTENENDTFELHNMELQDTEVENTDIRSEDQREYDTEPSRSFLSSASDVSGKEDYELPLAPIQLSCGSFEDPYTYFGDSDLVFVFSSCYSNEMMMALSAAIGRQCQPGTIIITTEYSLPLQGTINPLEDDPDMPFGSFRLELLNSVDGWCWLTGGKSTAYFHRVVDSLWQRGVGERKKPEVPLDVQAWRLVQAMESGDLTDSNRFLGDVSNNMMFHGFPDEWMPKLEDD